MAIRASDRPMAATRFLELIHGGATLADQQPSAARWNQQTRGEPLDWGEDGLKAGPQLLLRFRCDEERVAGLLEVAHEGAARGACCDEIGAPRALHSAALVARNLNRRSRRTK